MERVGTTPAASLAARPVAPMLLKYALSSLSSLVALVLAGSLAEAQDWPRFRGPNGTGASSTTGLPDSFGPEENLRWRTPVVTGQSSPVLGADAVFLTGADEEALVVLCLDRATGAVRWERRLERAHRQEVYPANGSATPTPTTDGKNVYAFFPELGLVAFDAEGAERWRLPLGPFVSFYGMAASPILAGSTLVLLCDQQQGSFLLAVDVASGKPRWRTERAGMIESWTTPVLYPSAEAPRSIVVFGTYFVCAYALDTGKELWRQGGVGYTPVCSPVLAAGAEDAGSVLVASVPFHAEQPMPAFADLLEADSDGDGKLARSELDGSDLAEHFGWADPDRDGHIVAEEWEFVRAGMSSKDHGCVGYVLGADGAPRERWRHKRGLPSIASPLLADGVVYLIKEGGMLTTLDAASGEELGFERLEDAPGGFDASPVTADGKVYLASSEGQILVLSAGGTPQILARCDLGEEIDATPALGGGSLFVRTAAALYCFARGE